jgi:tetratricopeptide (TPR) repeat protein
VDQLLREADLQILADPRHLPALWARLFALEAAGRHLELGGAMRAVVDAYSVGASAERQFNQLAAVMQEKQDRMRDPQSWEQVALLMLLRGKYKESVDMYGRTRQYLVDDPAEEARVCSWQAMAAFLASEPGEARRVLREALALQPDDELLRLRLSVIPEDLGS